MSITSDTANTWKNIENNYSSIESTTIHNIKDPDNYIKEPKFDETIQPLNTTKTNRIEDNDENILQKIRKIPAYLYKNINNNCLLCSSYKKM
jgi:hypothetical protein